MSEVVRCVQFVVRQHGTGAAFGRLAAGAASFSVLQRVGEPG